MEREDHFENSFSHFPLDALQLTHLILIPITSQMTEGLNSCDLLVPVSPNNHFKHQKSLKSHVCVFPLSEHGHKQTESGPDQIEKALCKHVNRKILIQSSLIGKNRKLNKLIHGQVYYD